MNTKNTTPASEPILMRISQAAFRRDNWELPERKEGYAYHLGGVQVNIYNWQYEFDSNDDSVMKSFIIEFPQLASVSKGWDRAEELNHVSCWFPAAGISHVEVTETKFRLILNDFGKDVLYRGKSPKLTPTQMEHLKKWCKGETREVLGAGH